MSARNPFAPRTFAVAAAAAALALCGVVLAHVRLTTGGGNPLFWSSPGTISLVINSTGSDDIPDGSHTTAVRNALDAWNAIEQSTAVILEDATPAQRARTDWQNDNIHLVLFDETGASGFFPGASGIVAITPVSYFVPSGAIADADILFNGKNHSFTTSAEPGSFDVQDVVTHELGHLLGLDHSGWAGATMYPYVDPTVILHRSLSMDEVRGLRDAYPSQGFATITGRVVRSDGTTPVSGAHVVARDASGRTTCGTLTDGSGNFTLRSLPGATFTVYATPLEGGVSPGNFGVVQAVQTNFQSTILGASVSTLGGSAAMGDVQVDDDTALVLGSLFDNYPLRVVAGTTQSVTIRGNGLVAGSALELGDPTLTVVGSPDFNGGNVQFDVSVPPGAGNGHVDVQVTNLSGDLSILPAALEVTPADPTVDVVTPAVGPSQGGTALTITGTGFQSGSRVVIGTRIYRDGQPGGCVVQSPTQITLTTNATMPGTHDVVVFDPSGIEGRMASAYTAAAPRLDTVFPVAGEAAGGTAVVLRGNDFLAGAVVEIDGVVQGSAAVVALDRIELSTAAATAGGPYIVRVTNPGGATAELAAAFSYVADPDPEIASLSPPSGPASGGTLVSILGANFDADTTVVFGADPTTGLGGTLATSVTILSPTGLRAVAPPGSGTVSVLVRQGDTAQADVLASSFTYQAPAGGGGGGGGSCSIQVVGGPPSARDALANGAWFALLLGLLAWRARRVPALARADRPS